MTLAAVPHPDLKPIGEESRHLVSDLVVGAEFEQNLALGSLTLQAVDSAGNVGKTSVGVVQFAFKTSSGFKSTRAIRKWSFSGFQDTSRPIYGHFRFGGKTRANYRFGKPTGPCGLLSKRAPGIPARSRAGTWTIQIDQNRAYKPNEKVALKVTSFVSLVPR